VGIQFFDRFQFSLVSKGLFVGFPVLGKTFDVRFNLIPLGVVFLRRVHGIPDYVSVPKGWQYAAERRDFFP
jgi:hypothetical protein